MVGNLVLYNGSLLNRIQNEFAEMEKTLNELFSDSNSPMGFNSGFPKCNLVELDDKFVIEMAVAGFDKKDIHVRIVDGEIKVKGEKAVSKDNAKYHLKELSNRAFAKSISIPKTINAEKIKAKVNNGILEIEMPKTEKTTDTSREIGIE